MNIAIVEDLRLDREKLQREILKWFHDNKNSYEIKTFCFDDGQELLKIFEPDKFQIIFIDIIMQNLNGIDTAHKIRIHDKNALIIFTTSSKDYAFEAFPLHAFDYIIKPCTTEKISHVLNEAITFLEKPEPLIKIKISRSDYDLKLRDISSVMSQNHSVEVVLSNGKKILCSMKFQDFKINLENDSRFLECNRGIIINMDEIASLSRDRDIFIMKNNFKIPVRVRERIKIIEKFTQYQISKVRADKIYAY